jgi:hypothetical protein
MGGEPKRCEEKNLFSLPDNILGILWSQWLSVHDFFLIVVIIIIIFLIFVIIITLPVTLAVF